MTTIGEKNMIEDDYYDGRINIGTSQYYSWQLVYNHHTSPDILCGMVKHESVEIRRAIADNPSTPPDALNILSRDFDIYVRRLVTRNRNTPAGVLACLTKDEDSEIRQLAIWNIQIAHLN